MAGEADAAWTIRPRRPDDVPGLCEVLARQQPVSGYPVEWPLPFPVEGFVVRDRELRAWTAEAAGRPVGHVGVRSVEDDPAGMAQTWADAAGLALDRLGEITALFIDLDQRGRGVGGALLDEAESWIVAQGRVPVLDVARGGGTAAAVYRHRGWTEVGRARPPWLPDDLPAVTLMALLPG